MAFWGSRVRFPSAPPFLEAPSRFGLEGGFLRSGNVEPPHERHAAQDAREVRQSPPSSPWAVRDGACRRRPRDLPARALPRRREPHPGRGRLLPRRAPAPWARLLGPGAGCTCRRRRGPAHGPGSGRTWSRSRATGSRELLLPRLPAGTRPRRAALGPRRSSGRSPASGHRSPRERCRSDSSRRPGQGSGRPRAPRPARSPAASPRTPATLRPRPRAGFSAHSRYRPTPNLDLQDRILGSGVPGAPSFSYARRQAARPHAGGGRRRTGHARRPSRGRRRPPAGCRRRDGC